MLAAVPSSQLSDLGMGGGTVLLLETCGKDAVLHPLWHSTLQTGIISEEIGVLLKGLRRSGNPGQHT